MNITVNNKATETQAATLAQLAEELSLPATGIAAAVNNKMIPHPQWTEHPIHEGDSVVIIKAVCGG